MEKKIMEILRRMQGVLQEKTAERATKCSYDCFGRL